MGINFHTPPSPNTTKDDFSVPLTGEKQKRCSVFKERIFDNILQCRTGKGFVGKNSVKTRVTKAFIKILFVYFGWKSHTHTSAACSKVLREYKKKKQEQNCTILYISRYLKKWFLQLKWAGGKFTEQSGACKSRYTATTRVCI